MARNASKTNLSWQEFHKLSKRLVSEVRKSGFVPDVIIAVSRGGLVPAVIFSHEFVNKNLYTIKVEYYEFERFMKRKNERKRKPKIAQGLDKSVRGKRLLVVDEVVDSGKSMKEVLKYLGKRKPMEVRVAVMHLKPWSKFMPDYFVQRTKKWIVYPWEKG